MAVWFSVLGKVYFRLIRLNLFWLKNDVNKEKYATNKVNEDNGLDIIGIMAEHSLIGRFQFGHSCVPGGEVCLAPE